MLDGASDVLDVNLASPSPPSSPSSRHSTPPSPSPTLSANDIVKTHQLPPILSRMDETDMVQIAYACEERNVLRQERNIAESRYRQMILVTRTYELNFLAAQNKLENADKRLDGIVDTAAKDVHYCLNAAGSLDG